MLLSPAATTAVLERLERHGHVRRERHPTDRRPVSVVVTDSAPRLGIDTFAELGEHPAPALARRADAELAMIAECLETLADATAAARSGARRDV